MLPLWIFAIVTFIAGWFMHSPILLVACVAGALIAIIGQVWPAKSVIPALNQFGSAYGTTDVIPPRYSPPSQSSVPTKVAPKAPPKPIHEVEPAKQDISGEPTGTGEQPKPTPDEGVVGGVGQPSAQPSADPTSAPPDQDRIVTEPTVSDEIIQKAKAAAEAFTNAEAATAQMATDPEDDAASEEELKELDSLSTLRLDNVRPATNQPGAQPPADQTGGTSAQVIQPPAADTTAEPSHPDADPAGLAAPVTETVETTTAAEPATTQEPSEPSEQCNASSLEELHNKVFDNAAIMERQAESTDLEDHGLKKKPASGS